MKTHEFWEANGKSILRLALAGTRIPTPPECYPLSARLTYFLPLHVDTKGLFEKRPTPYKLESLEGLSERSLALLMKISKTQFANVMNALQGNTLRLVQAPLVAQCLLDKTSTRYELDQILTKLSQAKMTKQVMVTLKGRGLKQLINKRSFAVKEQPKKRKLDDQATTSKSETKAAQATSKADPKAAQGDSKVEDDVL